MAKTAKNEKRGEEKGDPYAEKIIGVLDSAAGKARKDFEAQLPHTRKATLGVHARAAGKKGMRK